MKVPQALRVGLCTLKSVTLQSQEKYDEALTTLLKNKPICEGKDCEYHLNMGRILARGKKDYAGAIVEYQKAIPLLREDVAINPIDRQYLLNWAKYNIGLNFCILGKEEEGKHWKSESTKHYFDYNKVSDVMKSVYITKIKENHK